MRAFFRGRELFLGKVKDAKLVCTDCHGVLARGDGKSFVPQEIFNHVVFGGNPSEREQRIAQLDGKMKDLWVQKLDEWGNPLRPNNLNRGVYKGGRRPIDIYWRIAKGITGAQMPSHYPGLINEQQVWDLVNFVLQLPYEPGLIEGATAPLQDGSSDDGRSLGLAFRRLALAAGRLLCGVRRIAGPGAS